MVDKNQNNNNSNVSDYIDDYRNRKNNLQSIQIIINSGSSSDRISIHYKIAETLQMIQGNIDIVTASDDTYGSNKPNIQTFDQLVGFDQQNPETETLVVFDNYTDQAEMFKMVDYVRRQRDHYIILKRSDDKLHPWVDTLAREIRI